MKQLTTTLLLTLITFFSSAAQAWPEVGHSHSCDAAAKVIHDYKSNPQAWKDRDLYTKSRKATLYVQANCPEIKVEKIGHAAMQKPQQVAKARPASCKDCFNAGYRKGFKAGQSTVQHHTVKPTPSTHKPAMIQHGDHAHHTAVQKADCELTDALNRRAGPVVKVVRQH